MDIQGWLQGTADRAPPNPSDELDAGAFIQPFQSIEATSATRYHRKRRRAASDSSLIAPQPRTDHRGREGDHSALAGRPRHVKRPISRSGSTTRYNPRDLGAQEDGKSRSRERSEPKLYERRARHKTKPDKYEPKLRKTKEKKRRDDSHGRESKRKSTRTRRGPDGKQTESLVQGFRLQNRPLDSRLTLKADVDAGLFRHGRASAQVAGRNNGLPDLSFNEMKFLRDCGQHQDKLQDHNGLRNLGNQEKKREAERDEMSAYFNHRASHSQSRRPVLQVRETNRFPTDIEPTTHDDHQESSSPMLREEQLPAVPSLGFGSKGSGNQSSKSHASTASYLTWSVSVPDQVPSKTTETKPKAPRKPGRLETQIHRLHRQAGPENEPINGRPISGKKAQQRARGHWEKSRHARGHDPAVVYIPLETSGHAPSTGLPRARDTTSPSLPVVPPRAIQARQQETIEHQGHPSSNAESFNTSDILKMRGRLSDLAEQPSRELTGDRAPKSAKEKIVPSSSPIAKVLQMAQRAMMQNRLETITRQPTTTRQSGDHYVIAEREVLHDSQALFPQKMARPRLQSLVHHEYADEATARPPSPAGLNNRHGITRGEYHNPHAPLQEQTARPPFQPLNRQEYTYAPDIVSPSLRNHHIDEQMQQDAPDQYGVYTKQGDADMLDMYSLAQPRYSGITSSNANQTHGITYAAPPPQSDMHSLPFIHERPLTWMRGTPRSRGDVSTSLRGTPSKHMFAEQREMSMKEDHDLGGLETDDGLEGFWRPNRLY